MTGYLDKFRGSLGQVQAQQINSLLRKKRDKGEITTVEEFKIALSTLTRDLLSQKITPSLKLFIGEKGKVIDSESYNFMLDRIQDDLTSAFSEATSIDEILNSHNNIISQVALKSIRYSIAELENRVNIYSFLNGAGKNKGWDQAQFNTFRSSESLLTNRSDPNAGFLFTDFKTRKAMHISEDAQIESTGERLILGVDKKSYVEIKDIEHLFNDGSIQSEVIVEFENNNIRNTLDGQNNTFWLYSFLLSSAREGGAKTQLELRLAGKREINFLEIEPASPYPMILKRIQYLDSTKVFQTILNDSITLNGPAQISFPKITTDTLLVEFLQPSYIESQFEEKAPHLFYRAALSIPTSPSLEPISAQLRSQLQSAKLLTDIIGITENRTPGKMRRFYEYIIGIDNLKVGAFSFDERSILVGPKVSIKRPGLLSIRTVETRPVQETNNITSYSSITYPNPSGVEPYFVGSIEYYLVKKNFTLTGALIGTDVFPILPSGASRVMHERLFFTDKVGIVNNNNAGNINFYTKTNISSTTGPYNINTGQGDIRVYRNGTLLASKDIDASVTDGWYLGAIEKYPNNKTRMRVQLVIQNPTSNDVFTVSYTPAIGNTFTLPATLNTESAPSEQGLSEVVDLIGDISVYVVQDNVIVFKDKKGPDIINRSDLYLVILLTNNSFRKDLSPALEEYMLLTGKSVRAGDA